MAIWHFRFSLVPEWGILRAHGHIPTELDRYKPMDPDASLESLNVDGGERWSHSSRSALSRLGWFFLLQISTSWIFFSRFDTRRAGGLTKAVTRRSKAGRAAAVTALGASTRARSDRDAVQREQRRSRSPSHVGESGGQSLDSAIWWPLLARRNWPLFSPPPTSLNEVSANEPNFWDGRRPSTDPEILQAAAAMLPPMESWSKEAVMFGVGHGHRIELWDEDVNCRIDLSTFDADLLCRMVDLAERIRCRIVLGENGRVLEAEMDHVADALRQSRAFSFIADPVGTLQAIGRRRKR